jgi:hypothetical protein
MLVSCRATTFLCQEVKQSCYSVGFEVLTAVVVKSTALWDIKQCSPVSVNRRFGGTYRLHLQGRKISESKRKACFLACNLLPRWFLAEFIFSILKMEAIYSSETSVDTQWRHIPEDCTLRSCYRL